MPTPRGVARVCIAIVEHPETVFHLPFRHNTVAVLTDGFAVLGPDVIGAMVALPVVEGKAALFKRHAGVDTWAACLDTQDTNRTVGAAKALSASYGGISLEDVAAARCSGIKVFLCSELHIPVLRDDHGGAAIPKSIPTSLRSFVCWLPMSPVPTSQREAALDAHGHGPGQDAPDQRSPLMCWHRARPPAGSGPLPLAGVSVAGPELAVIATGQPRLRSFLRASIGGGSRTSQYDYVTTTMEPRPHGGCHSAVVPHMSTPGETAYQLVTLAGRGRL